MTTRKEDAAPTTGETTSYTTTKPKPAPTPTAEAPSTHCTETWAEALELGYFGEASHDEDLVFPGPQPEPPPPEGGEGEGEGEGAPVARRSKS